MPRLHPPLAGILSLQHMPGPSGKGTLVSAGRDGTVRVWQLDEGTGALSRWAEGRAMRGGRGLFGRRVGGGQGHAATAFGPQCTWFTMHSCRLNHVVSVYALVVHTYGPHFWPTFSVLYSGLCPSRSAPVLELYCWTSGPHFRPTPNFRTNKLIL